LYGQVRQNVCSISALNWMVVDRKQNRKNCCFCSR